MARRSTLSVAVAAAFVLALGAASVAAQQPPAAAPHGVAQPPVNAPYGAALPPVQSPYGAPPSMRLYCNADEQCAADEECDEVCKPRVGDESQSRPDCETPFARRSAGMSDKSAHCHPKSSWNGWKNARLTLKSGERERKSGCSLGDGLAPVAAKRCSPSPPHRIGQ